VDESGSFLLENKNTRRQSRPNSRIGREHPHFYRGRIAHRM